MEAFIFIFTHDPIETIDVIGENVTEWIFQVYDCFAFAIKKMRRMFRKGAKWVKTKLMNVVNIIANSSISDIFNALTSWITKPISDFIVSVNNEIYLITRVYLPEFRTLA